METFSSIGRVFTDKKRYFASTRTLAFGLIFILPVLIAYELLVIWSGRENIVQVRNHADILLKSLFQGFGIHGPFIFGVVCIVVIFIVLYLRDNRTSFKIAFFLGAVVESTCYATLIGFVLSRITHQLLLAVVSGFRINTMLALGAGVYEELVFRSLFFAGMGYVFVHFQLFRPFVAYLLSAIISSLLFSWFHYIGGETFTLYSSVFRFLAGLFFCGLYWLRGLGIAVWTHALYDFFLIF